MDFSVELSHQAQADVAGIYDWLRSQESGDAGERSEPPETQGRQDQHVTPPEQAERGRDQRPRHPADRCRQQHHPEPTPTNADLTQGEGEEEHEESDAPS